MAVGDVAAAVGYFWVGGLGDGYAVGCGEAVELGLAWCAGFVDPGTDAGNGGGDVSGGGFVSVVLGEETGTLASSNYWASAIASVGNVYGVISGWDCKEKSSLIAVFGIT